MKGQFIVIEGPDGSGKSTLAQGIIAHLEERGTPHLHVREPGGTEIGERIRTILLDPENHAMIPRTEALLYAASRAQLVEEKICPALAEGKIVICERYILSSLVYQGLSRGLPVEEVASINSFATDDLAPDYIFYIQLDPAIRRKRMANRTLDRLERESDFQNQTFLNYQRISEKLAEELIFLDGNQSATEMIRDCMNVLEENA